MSKPRRSHHLTSFQQQSQRLKSFRSLLDPTDLLPGHNVADLYSLRHLCLQGGGIPDAASTSADGWLRAQAWRVLLGYLTPEKSEWNQLLERRRAEYYQFVADFLPQHGSTNNRGIPGKLSERDALLDQIYRDLSRSRKNAFAFYRDEVKPSSNCPLSPRPATHSSETVERLAERHSLLRRLEVINDDFAYAIGEERRFEKSTKSAKSQAPARPESGSPETPKKHKETLLSVSNSGPINVKVRSPSITLEPASPGSTAAYSPGPASATSDDDASFASADEHASDEVGEGYIDRRWHSLLRILYIYALLNPSTGYVQGMNEVLFVLLYVMGTSGHLPSVKPFLDNQDAGPDQSMPSFDETLLSDVDADASSSFRYLDRREEAPGSHAEADAFWCFSALVGETRDLYDFDGIDHAGLKIINRRQAEPDTGSTRLTGMAASLKKFSLRLKWLDEELWQQLCLHSLDPRLPYYSFRWLACLVSTELNLPSVVRVWDAILAESSESSGGGSGNSSPKVEFLIDVCCALLTNIRAPLLDALAGGQGEDEEGEDSFGRAMKVLQSYPDDDVGPILEVACLYQQKRLAAPLTGDAPPSEDEDESMLSVRDRAANTLRSWANVSTPSRSSKWFNQTPRTPSQQSEASTPSRSSSAALFKRYTEALQSSDAAANLSKTSTNWTAKAMATWGGHSKTNGKDGGQTSPLAEMRASVMNRVMSGSNPSSPSSAPSQVHPSLRWSVQSTPPNLPLPNVNDSPPYQDEGSFGQSPLRGQSVVNRLQAGPNAGSPIASPDLGYIDSTPGTSPLSGSISRFGGLSSLQGTPRSTVRGAGPKPLLLTGSARPPREGSANGTLAAEDTSSRKISSGPLAANVSPRSRRGRNSSGQRDSSYTGSMTSSVTGTDSPSNEAWEEGTSVVSGKSDSVTLPALPSLQAAKDVAQPLPTSGPPPGLQGSGHGTVPASAFAKVRLPANGGTAEEPAGASRPVFGQVASSADVALTSKSTLQRNTAKRKDSGHGSPPGADAQETMSSPRDSGTSSSNGSQPFRLSSSATIQSSLGAEAFDQPRPAPVPPLEDTSVGEGEVMPKYSLSDEPVGINEGGPIRQSSNSSTRSFGVVRSKRTVSGGKRERTSSRRSLGKGEEAGQDTGGSDLITRGGRESLRLGRIETDVPSSGRGESQLEAGSGPGGAPHSPGLPSPGPEDGQMLPADELFDRLHFGQDRSKTETEASTGGEGKYDSHANVKRSTPTFMPRDVYSDEELEADSGSRRARRGIDSEDDFDEHYAKDGMAAIGSALAFAASADEDEDEVGGTSEAGHPDTLHQPSSASLAQGVL